MGTPRHVATFLRTFSTRFGALPAMVHAMGMFFALSRAGFAEVGAELADIGRVLATAGHERNCRVTNLSTVPIKPNTVDLHRNIFFTEAGLRAGITGYGASLAGFGAGLIGRGS